MTAMEGEEEAGRGGGGAEEGQGWRRVRREWGAGIRARTMGEREESTRTRVVLGRDRERPPRAVREGEKENQ